MIGAHKDVNGSRDLTSVFHGLFDIRGPALATINLSPKFEVSFSIHYEDMKRDTKC